MDLSMKIPNYSVKKGRRGSFPVLSEKVQNEPEVRVRNSVGEDRHFIFIDWKGGVND